MGGDKIGFHREHIVNSISSIADLCNENLVTILQHGELENNVSYFIDMEFCDLNLRRYVSGEETVDGLPEWSSADKGRVVSSVMRDVLAGLSYMHLHGKFHGAIKLNNSMIPVEKIANS